jgi:hypothetical protein
LSVHFLTECDSNCNRMWLLCNRSLTEFTCCVTEWFVDVTVKSFKGALALYCIQQLFRIAQWKREKKALTFSRTHDIIYKE